MACFLSVCPPGTHTPCLTINLPNYTHTQRHTLPPAVQLYNTLSESQQHEWSGLASESVAKPQRWPTTTKHFLRFHKPLGGGLHVTVFYNLYYLIWKLNFSLLGQHQSTPQWKISQIFSAHKLSFLSAAPFRQKIKSKQRIVVQMFDRSDVSSNTVFQHVLLQDYFYQ